MCRRNVLREIQSQDIKIAEKLGINESQITQQDRYTRMKKGLDEELDNARNLLDQVTSELSQGKLKVTEGMKAHIGILEKAVADREDEGKDRLVSPVDPDARMGKKESKRWAGYKGHLVVEEESEIITSVDTTPANKADGNQLKRLLDQQEKALSLVPEELTGDKAYDAGANLELLEDKHIVGNISLTSKSNNVGPGLFTIEEFHYDAASNTLTCPAGCVASHRKRDVVHREDQHRKGTVFEFTRSQCSVCNLKAKCHPSNSKIHGRQVHLSYYEPVFQQMKARMASEEGKEAYRNRYKIEHKIADLTRRCGMRHCRYRGLVKAKIHTLLSAITSNIKRMARLLWRNGETPPFSAVVS
jgi:IS5 family transposase